MVTVDPGDRIHFQDWTAPDVDRWPGTVGIVLIHGLGQTTWIWAPVARRLGAAHPTAAMDLRGHGLSDAPTEDGAYDLDLLAEDVVAVAEGADFIRSDDPAAAVCLVGHGFGAIVAAVAAEHLGSRCSGLVLVDGGWERIEDATGQDVDEFLRGLDEPPEVMSSMRAFLRDRRGYDPVSWDADQEAAARATVVETHAGRVLPSTRPHALDACVRAMFGYDPGAILPGVEAPITAIVADSGADAAVRVGALAAIDEDRVAAGRGPIRGVRLAAIGHNLMRYRPLEVTAEILDLADATADRH
jgi:pimeloyl-ACP methyl ester carboxylesterase